MAYKKPEVIAKSEAKQSFVAGCPMHTVSGSWCAKVNGPKCQVCIASRGKCEKSFSEAFVEHKRG